MYSSAYGAILVLVDIHSHSSGVYQAYADNLPIPPPEGICRSGPMLDSTFRIFLVVFFATLSVQFGRGAA